MPPSHVCSHKSGCCIDRFLIQNCNTALLHAVLVSFKDFVFLHDQTLIKEKKSKNGFLLGWVAKCTGRYSTSDFAERIERELYDELFYGFVLAPQNICIRIAFIRSKILSPTENEPESSIAFRRRLQYSAVHGSDASLPKIVQDLNSILNQPEKEIILRRTTCLPKTWSARQMTKLGLL